MKTKINIGIIHPLAIAVSLGLFTGCQSAREQRVHERTDPNRPSSVQTSEGYDTFGRKWGEAEAKPGAPAPAPEPAARPMSQATAGTAPYLVSLVKRAPGLVTLGDSFAYELSVTAQTEVGEVVVVDTLPAGVTYVSSTPAAAQEGNKLTWKIGDMNKGETKAVTVTVKADKQGELVNCTTVSAVPRVCVSTMVGKPQLAISKTGPQLAQLGKPVEFNIVVRNTGNSPAKGVVVTDTVPDGLTYAGGQKEVVMQVGDLAPAASKTLPITLTANKRGKFVNKAVASSSNAGRVEAEAPVTVVQAALKIEKTTKDKDLFINRTAAYDIVVSNPGDTDLTGVVVTDTAAPETVIATAEGATVTGSTATWNVGTLRAGEKKNLAVKILSRTPGRFTNRASVTSTEGLQDAAQDWSEWKGVTGVLLEMVDETDPIQVGETTKFTIRVTNQGTTQDIKDLRIVATLPAELEVVPGTVTDGGVVSGKTITWPVVGSVAPKATTTHTYTAKALKAGDARSKVGITTSLRTEPIEKFESTTVY